MSGGADMRTVASVGLRLSLLAVLVGVVSCRYARTEIVLRVETDMPQGAGQTLTDVRVVVRSQEASTVVFDRSFRLVGSASEPFLPADMGIVPRDGDATRIVTVEVTAIRAGTENLFTTTAVATFESGRTTLLRVFLANRCLDPANRVCPNGQTCGPTGCEAQRRSTLPEFGDAAVTDVLTPQDVTSDRVDVSGPFDAVDSTSDGSPPDVSPLDAQDAVDSPLMDLVTGDTDSTAPDVPTTDVSDVAPVDIVTSMDVVAPDVVSPPTSCGAISRGSNGMLGDLVLNAVAHTLNTDTGELRETISGTVVLAPSLSAPPSTTSTRAGVSVVAQTSVFPFPPPQIAVFDVGAFTLPVGGTINVTGSRALAILALGDVTLGGRIDMTAGAGTAGATNAVGLAGRAGAGGSAGGAFRTGIGCGSGQGDAVGPGRGAGGECGGTGARGTNGDASGSGGGGGGGGCAASGGAGGSHALTAASGADGATATPSSPGTAPGVPGVGGLSCSVAPRGALSQASPFDDTLMPLVGGSGGGAGGFGGLSGSGATGGNGGGLGGTLSFAGGPGGGGGGGGALLVCTGTRIDIPAAGVIAANGGNGGFAGSADFANAGSGPIITLTGPRGGGGGGGASGAGGGGGGGSGGSVYLQASSVTFMGRIDTGGGIGAGGGFARSGGTGASGRNGGGTGGAGGGSGAGGRGSDGTVGRIRVVSPSFLRGGITVGAVRVM